MKIDYDSLSEGQNIDEVKRIPSRDKVLRFLGATWMWGDQFLYPDAAAQIGLPGPIVPGPMKHAYLQQYLNQWLSGSGIIRRLQISHRRPDVHDAEITLGATITRLHTDNGVRNIELEVYIDNQDDERSVRGSATIVFQ